MSSHVVCVWDFQCLLKALQRRLTCVELPWLPTPDPEARRLINEIVLDEESDITPEGGHLSHFELYRAAMRDAGADGRAIDTLLARLTQGEEVDRALGACGLPPAATAFARTTLRLAGEPAHIAASAFAWGREEIIPDMFRRLVGTLAMQEPARWGRLRFYLERHIERDGEVHSVAARELVARLCGEDAERLAQARDAAREALLARLALWDELFVAIREAGEAVQSAAIKTG